MERCNGSQNCADLHPARTVQNQPTSFPYVASQLQLSGRFSGFAHRLHGQFLLWNFPGMFPIRLDRSSGGLKTVKFVDPLVGAPAPDPLAPEAPAPACFLKPCNFSKLIWPHALLSSFSPVRVLLLWGLSSKRALSSKRGIRMIFRSQDMLGSALTGELTKELNNQSWINQSARPKHVSNGCSS